MLDSLIQKLPRNLLAILIIIAGIGFVLLNDPPHQFCDVQVDNFKSKQRGLLFKDSKNKVYDKPLIVRSLRVCRETVSPGACYEYFSYINRMLRDFKLVSTKCLNRISSLSEVRSHLFQAMDTMTQLAWREEVIIGKADKLNWLSPSDLVLFCSIKKTVVSFYGQKTLKRFEQSILSNLRNSKKLPISSLRGFSILSESCAKHF